MDGILVGTLLFCLLVYGFITGFDDGRDRWKKVGKNGG